MAAIRAHEATTILFREACTAAGEPTKYPEQIRQGLGPGQAKKLYFAAPPAAPDAGGRGGRGRGLGDGGIAGAAKAARNAFDTGDNAATAQPVEAGLAAIRALRAQLASMRLDDQGCCKADPIKMRKRLPESQPSSCDRQPNETHLDQIKPLNVLVVFMIVGF